MTAAGIAFIAGGLATLISLRSVLFGGGKRRRERRAETTERRPVEQRAIEQRPVERRAIEQRPVERRAIEQRPVERRAIERRAIEQPPVERRAVEQRPIEQRPIEQQPAERPRRPADNRRRLAERPRPEIAETAYLVRLPPDAHHDLHPGPRRGRGADDDPGGLASIGLAAEEEADRTDEPERSADPLADPIEQLLPAGSELEKAELEHADPARAQPEHAELENADLPDAGPEPAEHERVVGRHQNTVAVTPGDKRSRPISVRRVDRSDRRHGDRVTGWVRPEYRDDPAEAPVGEYWTPVPMGDLDYDLAEVDPEPSARGYGWPIPVERLPAVPDYEPATGFDLIPVPAEPTELVPVWTPDRRVRLPPSWPNRNEKPADNRFLENEPRPRRRPIPEEADQRFRAPAVEPERRRPRPRPRPAPSTDNVYVSRHAAEPPRGTG